MNNALKNLTATKLRLILIVALLLLAVAGVAIFTYGYHQIQAYAVSAQNTASQATASNSSLQNLIATKATLDQDSDVVQRAQQLVSESKSYVYQDQIISDMNKFANKAHITITNITFADAKTTTVKTAGSSSAGGSSPSGVKSMTATVTLQTPIRYSDMLNFIHLIEQSLFRMQISTISLSRAGSDAGSDMISSNALTIEVYVR